MSQNRDLPRIASTRHRARAWLPSLLSLLVVAACGGRDGVEAPAVSVPEPAGPTIADAVARFRAQDLPGAAEILERVTQRESTNARAWSLLGQARKGQQDLDGALAAFERAVAADPTSHNAVYGTAAIQALRGAPVEALDLLHRLKDSGEFDLSQIALDPDLKGLHDDDRYRDLLMKPVDFADPFVEDTRVLHEWVGEAAGDEFGWIARNVGDVDGDGVADLVTSAPSKVLAEPEVGPSNVGQPGAGRVYVYSGRGGELLWQASGEPGDRLGEGIEAAGDVDGDGRPDVVASAPTGGKVHVYRGRDGKVLLTLEAAQDGERFGRSVAGIGDADGDGHDDLLVGAPQFDLSDAEGDENAGRVAVYSGRDGSVLHEWRGQAGDRLGAAVAGQVGEERSLIILGAPDAGDGDGGRVLVYGGLQAEPGFVIESDDAGSELGAMFLSAVGDVDGDGVGDVYASDWSYGAQGVSTGRIVVHSGIDGRQLLQIDGEAEGDSFGIGPADAGDVDGDGHDDLVVGAWRQASAAPAGGKVYLYSGKDGALMRAWTCRVMGDTFGFDATGMGDVDGDGQIDFLLTSAWSAVRGAKSGRVFLLAGG